MNVALERSFEVSEKRPTPAGTAECAAPELAVDNLAVAYGGGPAIFSRVSFDIGRGDAVALIGANGAGKSTLLKCFLGFVQPTVGEVLLFGQPVGALRPRAQRRLRSGIGFVAQRHNLVARLSVLSNVMHGLLATHPGPRHWMQALSPAAARLRALDALDRVGLADLALRRADSLSGGQSQRVAIARALVAEPRLILADEPAASLDPAASEEVMQVFREVVRDGSVTLLFTTHHVAHAVSYAQRVVGLREGRLALDAPSDGLSVGALDGLYE